MKRIRFSADAAGFRAWARPSSRRPEPCNTGILPVPVRGRRDAGTGEDARATRATIGWRDAAGDAPMIPIFLRILAYALLAAGATGWHTGPDALRVGQRVLTEVSVSGPGAPPRVSGEPDQTAVDPETWRVVSLRMPHDRHPGNYYEMELLQPPGWIARNGAAAGRWIDLSLPELGVSGMAQVLGIGPCPPIESGYGRVVLGTFTSVSSDVYELKLAGQDEPIGVTSGHPIWSLDRGDWIAAGALRPGERLATAAGAAVVESVTAQPGARRVYNLSVEGDHRYLVGELGVLAHNAAPCTPTSVNQMQKQIQTGKAPRTVLAAGTPRLPGEKPHIHFTDGSALNIDGTWKHGGRALTNAERDWLTSNGWKLPS